MPRKKKTALRKWLEKQPRGAMNSIAESMGVSRQYIYKIAEGEQVLSHDRARELATLTGINIKDFSHYRIHVPN